jgi:hypothetical protein
MVIMRTFTRLVTHGGIASALAALVALWWTKQLSILAYLLWVTLLFPPSALSTLAMWRICGTADSPALGSARFLEIAVAFFAGILVMYLESVALRLLLPKLFPQSFSVPDIALGIIAGAFAWHFRGKLRWEREV